MLDRGGIQLEEGVMVVNNKRVGSTFSFRSQYKEWITALVGEGLARQEWVTVLVR